MASDTLTATMIDAAERLLRQLDSVGFYFSAAAWVRDEASEEWRFYIVTPLHDRGPRRLYASLLRLYRLQVLVEPIEYEEIRFTSSSERKFETLAASDMFRFEGLGQARFIKTTINGVMFPEMLIYRMEPAISSHRAGEKHRSFESYLSRLEQAA